MSKNTREASPYKDVTRKTLSIGDTLWRLTVTGFYESDRDKVYCQCSCGNSGLFDFYSIRRGSTKSCGCFTKDFCKENFSSHKLSKHPLYRIWSGMISRCENKNNPVYDRYGSIAIAKEWREDFVNFYEWALANGYRKGLSIDRIDSAGDYCPENCRWATDATQARNRRATRGRELPKGVGRTKYGTYKARIMYDRKSIYLGSYATPEEAHEVYRAKALELFGVCYEAVR